MTKRIKELEPNCVLFWRVRYTHVSFQVQFFLSTVKGALLLHSLSKARLADNSSLWRWNKPQHSWVQPHLPCHSALQYNGWEMHDFRDLFFGASSRLIHTDTQLYNFVGGTHATSEESFAYCRWDSTSKDLKGNCIKHLRSCKLVDGMERKGKKVKSIIQIFMRSGVGPISLLDGSAGFADKGSVWIRWTLISLWHLISLHNVLRTGWRKVGCLVGRLIEMFDKCLVSPRRRSVISAPGSSKFSSFLFNICYQWLQWRHKEPLDRFSIKFWALGLKLLWRLQTQDLNSASFCFLTC